MCGISYNRAREEAERLVGRLLQSSRLDGGLNKVHSFPVAAVTSYLSGFKQRKFFLSQFWRPEVQKSVSLDPN